MSAPPSANAGRRPSRRWVSRGAATACSMTANRIEPNSRRRMSESAQMAAIRAPMATTMKTRRTKARSPLCSDVVRVLGIGSSWRQPPPDAHAGSRNKWNGGPKHREDRHDRQRAGERQRGRCAGGVTGEEVEVVAMPKRKGDQGGERDDGQSGADPADLGAGCRCRCGAKQGLGEIQAEEMPGPHDGAGEGEQQIAHGPRMSAHATALGKPCTSSRPSRPWPAA